MTSIPLEAREILHHLNSLGYRNISAEQLKEFMKDLKRLIKYEQIYSNSPESAFHNAHAATKESTGETTTQQQKSTFEKLHRQMTASALAKTATTKVSTKPQEKPTEPHRVLHKVHQKKDLRNVTKENRPCECPATITETLQASGSRALNAGGTRTNGILGESNHQTVGTMTNETKSTRSRSSKGGGVGSQQQIIRNTPTDLYQFYQRNWQRFKQQIPGEGSRTTLRSAIHKKMEHKPPPKPKVYLAVHSDHTKEMRRAWQQN